MSTHSPPVSPAIENPQNGCGGELGELRLPGDPVDWELHAAENDKGFEEGDDDIFGDDDPDHLGKGEIIELAASDDEEDCAPRRTAPDPG